MQKQDKPYQNMKKSNKHPNDLRNLSIQNENLVNKIQEG